MVGFTGSEVELARSVEFFQQPTSYKRFWLNRHAQIPEGCIDPRDEDRPEVHIIRQTPGGAAGRAVDTALSLYAYDKTKVGLCESLAYDESLGHSMVATAHRRCAYDLGREKIIDEIIDPSDFTKEALHRISRESIYMHVVGAGVILAGRADEYLQEREKSIEEIEASLQHQVMVLEGDHHECFMVLNTVPGTTFATKRFSDTFQGTQAFNYDIWRTFELAEKLFPLRADQHKKMRFIHARVATAIATLMVLTDGSQRLLVRTVEKE